MNFSMIRYIMGWVVSIESVFLLFPCLVALLYQEQQGFSFLSVMLLTALIGFALVFKKPKNTTIFAREGFVSAALCWIVMSLFGALPFTLSGDIPDYVNALFETISGFTTTGASVLPNVESLAYCSMFWRCFTHWIGGMGVIVFLLIVLPMAGGSCIHLLRAESTGPSVGKLVPRMRHTAGYLYIIYIAMTIVEFIFLLCGGMNCFDSLCIAFGSAGTGGFGILNSSFMAYSPYIQTVVAVFIVLFGVSFNIYFLLLHGKFVEALKSEELRCYFIIIAISTALITLNILTLFGDFWEALRHAFFQVSSIITTTGYSSVDFAQWPALSQTILVLLMFIGACAGSTGGGIKISRLLILIKSIRKEIGTYIHPRSIKKITIEGKAIEHETNRAANVYMIAYLMIFAVSLLLISLDNFDFTTNFTAIAATLNNIGPGLAHVGPTGNFNDFSAFSKFILMFDMITGRLEIFPMLVLFWPSTWLTAGARRKRGTERKFL